MRLLWVFDSVPTACRVVLNTEEFELAEPTVLGISPMTDSAASSGGWCAVSEPGSSRRDRDETPFSCPELSEARWPLMSTVLEDRESRVLILVAFSRSAARSFAARGAVGKYWAKPAPGGRVMVRLMVFYRADRPPTIITRVGDAESDHACVPMGLCGSVAVKLRAHIASTRQAFCRSGRAHCDDGYVCFGVHRWSKV